MRFPLRPHPARRALWLALCALTAACAPDAQPALPPSTLVTLPPQPIGTLIAGCDAAGLEAWYEVTSTLAESVAAEGLAALDLPPDTLFDTLVWQRDQIDRLLREPVPACASAAHAQIVQRVRALNAAFVSFEDAAITASELRARVTTEHQAIQSAIATTLSDVTAWMAELHRLETQAAPPSG